MSIALMTLAWALDIGPTDKLVLLALADWANDSDGGRCWPSMRALGDKSGLSERGLQGAVKRLVDAGHISRQEVTGKGVNYYVHPRIKCAPANDAPPHETTHTPAPAAGNTLGTVRHNKPVAGASRWHRLPDDWQPDCLPKSLEARRAAWPDGWEANQLDSFKGWAANAADANGKGRKLDWNQAWHNWLRSNEKDIRHGRPHTTADLQRGKPARRQVTDNPMVLAFARMAGHVDADGNPTTPAQRRDATGAPADPREYPRPALVALSGV